MTVLIIKSVILCNSKTVTHLVIPCITLPEDDVGPVTYPHLVTLSCSHLTGKTSASWPRLKRLTVTYAYKLDLLPPESLERLMIRKTAPAIPHQQQQSDGMNPDYLIKVISRLPNLKVICIRRGNIFPRVAVMNQEFCFKLLVHCTKLDFVQLSLDAGDQLPVPMPNHLLALIPHIVHMNPEIRCLCLAGIAADHLSIRCLSSLQKLEAVRFSYNGTDIVSDLLLLLRGKSRSQLSCIQVCCDMTPDQVVSIESELQVMQQETGFAYIFNIMPEPDRHCYIRRRDK
jgi:hypothetical protein